VKYKINYYGIILDFSTNSIVFAVISDLKSRSLLYVNGRRWWVRERRGGLPLAERKKNIGFLRFIAVRVFRNF